MGKHSLRSSTLFSLFLGACLLTLASCRTIKPIEDEIPSGFKKTDLTPQEVVQQIPQSDHQLSSIRGKGKALISSPEQSERSTLHFYGNRDTSRITIQNQLGIKGGEIMATGDSILVYNKIDREAHKLSFAEAHATQINSLASANLVEVLNYRITPSRIDRILANSQYYLLIMVDNTKVRVDRETYHIKNVQLPPNGKKPYNQIQYEEYRELEGFHLPRKLTITSADRRSRVTLLVQSLTINPENLTLSLDIPDTILIQRL